MPSDLVPDADSFRRTVQLFAKVHRLDLDLPEILNLMAAADDIITWEEVSIIDLLRELDPKRDVLKHREDSSVTILERLYRNPVLRPETVARIAVYKLDEHIIRIVANGSGTHLYDAYGNLLVTFMAAAIEPTRFATDSSREHNTLALIRTFTGHELDLKKLTGGVASITITREEFQHHWNEPVIEPFRTASNSS